MRENSCISVIVPVYCVEQYLEKCVSSIVNQTYKIWRSFLWMMDLQITARNSVMIGRRKISVFALFTRKTVGYLMREMRACVLPVENW